MVKVIVTAQSFCKNQALCHELLERGKGLFETVFLPDAHAMTREQLIAQLAGAEAALVGREMIDEAVLAALPELRCISKYGVGLDNVDQESCKKRGVALYYQAGVNAQAVAEHTMGLVLALLRNIDRSSRKLRQGQWWKNGGTGLRGKKFGIIGYGHIGTRVGALAKAFGCEILVHDKLDKTSEVSKVSGRPMSLKELLETSDIISIHVPLDTSTRQMIDGPAISLMKTGAFLINTARGGIVDEEALTQALATSKLGGAGFDVFEQEPPARRALLEQENFLGTAHIAGNSDEAVEAMGKAAIEGIIAYFVQAQSHKGKRS